MTFHKCQTEDFCAHRAFDVLLVLIFRVCTVVKFTGELQSALQKKKTVWVWEVKKQIWLFLRSTVQIHSALRDR